jgi:Na+/melibiose symporter-like transporter
MTQILFIPASLAGIAILAPKLWDMFTDPVIGILSDRTRTRFGRRRPFLLAGAIFMPLGLALMFAVPEGLNQTQSFWYVFILYGLSATAYTLFSVPYITIPAEISGDPIERVRVMSYRTGFVMLGVLIGSALPPKLVELFGGDRLAYGQVGIILAIICAITMLAALLSLNKVQLLEPDFITSDPLKEMKKALATPPFFFLCVTHILQISAVGTLLSASTYLAVFVLKSGTSLAGDFLGLTFLTAAVAMPVWNLLCRHMDKIKVFSLGGGFYAVVAIALVAASTEMSVLTFLIIGAAMGIGFASIQMIPYAILADVIHKHGEKHGYGNEGIFTGVWTALETFGFAISPFIFAVLLDRAGFIEGKGFQEQPEGIPNVILWLSGGMSALFIMLSFISLYYFWRQK